MNRFNDYQLHNTAEMLGLMCFVAIIVSIWRWKLSDRRDILLSFIVFMAGECIRELVVWHYGLSNWPIDAYRWLLFGRVFQLGGAILFLRASLQSHCGEWGWLAITFGTALLAIAIPS